GDHRGKAAFQVYEFFFFFEFDTQTLGPDTLFLGLPLFGDVVIVDHNGPYFWLQEEIGNSGIHPVPRAIPVRQSELCSHCFAWLFSKLLEQAEYLGAVIGM